MKQQGYPVYDCTKDWRLLRIVDTVYRVVGLGAIVCWLAFWWLT